jgi:lipopolysaccharide assembly protein A
MWLLQFILKAAIFFTLFAFALNNQHEVVVHFFFGTTWQAPLVLVVLAVFVLGVAVGVLGMVPRWWRQRRLAKQAQTPPAAPPPPVITKDTMHGV